MGNCDPSGQQQLPGGRRQGQILHHDSREPRTRSINIVEFAASSHNSLPITLTFLGQLTQGDERFHQWIARHENTAIKHWIAFGCPWPVSPLDRALAHVASILGVPRSLPEIGQTTGNIFVVLNKAHDKVWEGPLSRAAFCAETLTIIFMPPACPLDADTESSARGSSSICCSKSNKSIPNVGTTTDAVDPQFITKVGDSLGFIAVNSRTTRITVVGIWDWLPEDEDWEAFEDAVDEGLEKAGVYGSCALNLFKRIQFIAVEEFVGAVGQEQWGYLTQHATVLSI